MRPAILLCVLLWACSAREAPPMSGVCIDRVTLNLFDPMAPDVTFRQCRWRDQDWVCLLETGADAWRCVAVSPATRIAPVAPVAPELAGPTL